MVTTFNVLLAGLALLMLGEHATKLLKEYRSRTRLKRWAREYEADYTAKDGTCILCGEYEPHVCKARI